MVDDGLLIAKLFVPSPWTFLKEHEEYLVLDPPLGTCFSCFLTDTILGALSKEVSQWPESCFGSLIFNPYPYLFPSFVDADLYEFCMADIFEFPKP